MPVPPDDMLCRFISPDKWNHKLNLPIQRAFKQVDLSVWHRDQLLQRKIQIEDLLIENLVGCGQAHHTVDDYLKFAHTVTQDEGIQCQVLVEWRPDEAGAPWWGWRYAHVQVEAMEGPGDFPLEFRRLLAANSRHRIPPGHAS